jgi:hypothetical protein
VNAYLDEIVLEDFVSDPANPHLNGAYQLFRSQRNTDITSDAQLFVSQTTYPLLQRLYLSDEPHYNGYQPFNYVDNRIRTTVTFEGSATGRGRSTTATPVFSVEEYKAFARFMDAADPYEMLVDAYPINANVPADPNYISTSDAAFVGITAFDAATYNTRLQEQLDTTITRSFLQAIQNAKSNNIAWWYIPQVHGELCCSSHQYRKSDGTPMLRPPSPEEIRCMVYLALAYGAKGVFYFSFPTGRAPNFGGCSKTFFPGLVAYDSTITDQYPRNASATPNHSSNYDNFQGQCASVFTGYEKKYDAVKALNTELATLGPIVVNRDWVTAFTSSESAPGGSIVISLTGSYIEAATFNSDYIMLVNRKCHPTDVQTIEITTNKTGQWVMDDQLTHELFVSSNGVFKEVKFNPGQGRLFRLRAMTTNENWSGTINMSNAITIANGGTLTIQPSATLKFSSAASLIINGKIVASSTNPSQRITFTGATQTPGFWNGITINASAAPNVLRRCDVQYATNGISINYTGNPTQR